jgi:hypothetical protein
VHFNWIYTNPTDQSQKVRSIELEYALRPKIIKYLMERFENECDGDFSCFHFDVDVLTNLVSISPKTPPRFRLIALRDFDFFVNCEGDSRSVAS